MIQTTSPLMNSILCNMSISTYCNSMPPLLGMNSYMPMMPVMPMMPNFGSLFNFAMPSLNTGAVGGGSSSSGTKSQGYNSNALSNLKNASIFKGVPESTKSRILSAVDKACKQYNVDPKLVLAVIYRESHFNPNAKSKCGAMGLMQLMPSTAKSYGVQNAYDIEQNIQGGVKMLSKLLQRYNGDTRLAVAAYNAGPGRVKDKVPEIRETKNYVANVHSTMQSLG